MRTRDEQTLTSEPPRPELGRSPKTGRGAQTRRVLIEAASDVFWTKGYLDTRVADIAEAAGVSHGSFYTYFDSKEAILWAIIEDVWATLYTSGNVRSEVNDDPVAAVELATRRYFEAYRTNRKALRPMEEVAGFNPEMRALRLQLRERFIERVRRAIERMQKEGIADPDLDPALTAGALVSMVSSVAYYNLVGNEPFDLDVAVTTVTRIWSRAIGLETWTPGDQSV
jgi:AcrR family transcriptional regulator